MSSRVPVPPGCEGLTSRSGKFFPANRTGTVTVPDRYIGELTNSQKGMLAIKKGEYIGTKGGRKCSCSPLRVWNSWSVTCPKCGQDTVEVTC